MAAWSGKKKKYIGDARPIQLKNTRSNKQGHTRDIDTIDINIHLNRLRNDVGISGMALAWFKS